MLTPSRLLEERPLNSKALKKKREKSDRFFITFDFLPKEKTRLSRSPEKHLQNLKTKTKKNNNKRNEMAEEAQERET
jgi:hypothetical protein